MNEEMLKSLVNTRKILREKFKAIKAGKSSIEENLEKTFLPISKPIKELISETKANQMKQEANQIKQREFIKKKSSTPDKKGAKRKLFKDSESSSDSEIFSDFQDAETLLPHSNEEVLSDFQYLMNKDQLDTLYGLNKDSHGDWMFGNSYFSIKNNQFQINDKAWPLTPGLYSLLFHKKPQNYDTAERQTYKEILMLTNAHKVNYDSNDRMKGTKAYKYTNIIKKLFGDLEQEKGGASLMTVNANPANYIYWDDPNELVNRLRLLLASQSAGHNNHSNEVISIIEELKEAHLIH